MKSNYILKQLFFFILLFPCLLLAQAKTIISGTIENPTKDSIELVIDKNYLSKHLSTYKVPVRQNQFRFQFNLERNYFARLVYGEKQSGELYIEPNDSLVLKFKVDSIFRDMTFSGKGSCNNRFYKEINKEFKGDVFMHLNEEKIKSLGVDAYENVIYESKVKIKKFYDSYPDKNLLSDKFKKYIETLIKYNYLCCLYAYPVINANQSKSILAVNPLPSVMIDGVDKTKVSDEDAMICESYRDFLTWFVTYYASEANGFRKFTDYNVSSEKKYVVASNYLKGVPLLYFLTDFLMKTGGDLNPETVKRIYNEMEKIDKTSPYPAIVKEKLGKWMNTKVPKKVASASSENNSSDLKLMGLNGKEVHLSDFKGKVVYVDFWASWCGPCRQQFPFSKELHEKLTDKQKKQVVFLYISIDNTEDIWKNAIRELNLEGEHALSSGGWNSMAAKYFHINSIPRYLLIDKKGNIVNSNASRPSEENTLQDILDLLK